MAGVVEAGVGAVFRQEFGAGALFGDRAVFEDDDLAEVVHGGETVRDDEGGAAFHEVLDGVHDGGFGGGIESAGGFVEEEDGGVLEEGACDADALALADAEVAAAFADGAVEALGHLHDEVVGLGAFRGFDDFLVGGAHAAVGDVFLHSGREENGVLKDHADVGAEGFFGDVTNVVSVDADDAGCGVVESWYEAQKGAFARAGAADEGEDFPGGDGEIDVLKDRALGGVAEGDVFERD